MDKSLVSILVERYDRRYRTTVNANLVDGAVLGPVSAKITALQEQIALPPGTEFQTAGDAEIMGEVFSAFGIAMGLGIVLGVLNGTVPLFRRTFGPLALGIQTLPSICWLPLAVVWFGCRCCLIPRTCPRTWPLWSSS